VQNTDVQAAFAQTLAGPESAGRWMGLQNGFANFAGIVSPADTVMRYESMIRRDLYWAIAELRQLKQRDFRGRR